MRHFARALLVLGVLCVLLSPLSCRPVRQALVSAPDESRPVNERSDRSSTEVKQFLALLGFGIITLCVGEWLRTRARSPASMLSETLMLRRARCCSGCGKPLCRNECRKTRQWGFIPRLVCPECGGYAEWSCTVLLALALALIFIPILANCLFERVPDFIIAGGFFSFPAGLCLFILGLWDHNRQFEKMKRYMLARKDTNQV